MAKPLTKDERAAATELLAAATAYPWLPSKCGQGVISITAEPRAYMYREDCLAHYGGELVGESMEAGDVALICAAPELLERYEATVQALERALAELGIAS